MKKISLSISFLIFAFAISLLAGCESKDPQWEASKKALVEEFLASAQGITHGEITVDSTKKSVTIANLKVQKNIVNDEGQNLISLTVETDKLVATNVNFADAPSGVIDIAETAQLSNVTCSIAVTPSFLKLINVPTMSASDVINKTSTIQHIALEKIRDDAGLFLKTVAEQNIPLSKLLPQRENLHIASVSLKKIVSEAKLEDLLASMELFKDKQDAKVTYTTEEVRAKDVSIEGLHDYLLTNSVGELDGQKIFSIESSAIKNIYLPGLVANIALHDPKKLLSQEVSVEGMTDKNIRVFLPMGEVLAKETESNFVKKGNQLVFNSICKNFIIPSEVLDYFSKRGEFGKFSALYNKPLDFSTKIDLQGTLEDDGTAKLAISALELSEANLGKVNLGFALEDKNFDFPPKDSSLESLQLNNAKLFFQDKGIIDLGFAFAATMQSRIPLEEAEENGKAMRTLIAGLYPGMCLGSMGTENKAFCDEVAKLVKAPGSLEILLEPTEPIRFKSMGNRILRNPKEAGLTAKYTK